MAKPNPQAIPFEGTLSRVDFTRLVVFDAEGDYLAHVDGYVIVHNHNPKRAYQLMVRVHGRTEHEDRKAWGYTLHLDEREPPDHPAQLFMRRVEPFALAYYYLSKALTR